MTDPWQSRSDLLRSEQAREDGRFERERERRNMTLDRLTSLTADVMYDLAKARTALAAKDVEALEQALAFMSNHVGFVQDEILRIKATL